MTLSLDMLRHGVTDAGPGFRGSSDDALTEQGRQQMQLALAGKGGWDLVISSPLQRCESFAREFAEANGLPLRIEADLRELHFGAWEGRNSAEILLEDPQALGEFWNDPYRFTPPGAEPVKDFAQRVLAAVERLQAEGDRSPADLVLTVSQASAQSVRDWQGRLRQRRALPVVAAPIGTRLAAPDPAGLPPGLDLSRPFFVTLGTIEPRKNHALLLDAWQELSRRLDPPRLPQLLIVGSRGWENAETFARLDALPPGGPVRELNGLDDGAVAELLGRSHGLLMPSRAEGFGLPLTEAAARGIPVISAPLPVARELLGGYARYLPPDDARAWAGAVALLAAALPLRLPPYPVPQWDGHFAQVAAAIRERLPAGAAGAMPR